MRVRLHLSHRDRRLRQSPVGEAHAVVGVLPALVPERSEPRGPVLDVAVAVRIPGTFDPGERRLDGGTERPDLLDRSTPSPELVDEHHEQRRGVRRSVVDVAVRERERRPSRESDLVQDPARLLVGLRHVAYALHPREAPCRPQPEVRIEQQRHPRGEDRVPAEQRHVPRSSGGDEHVFGMLRIDQPQCVEIVPGPGERVRETQNVGGEVRELTSPSDAAARGRRRLIRLAAGMGRDHLFAPTQRAELDACLPRLSGR